MSKLKMYYRWAANYLIARLNCFSTYALPPRVLSIETTERCNLDCIMCPRTQTSLSRKEFTLEQFKHILSSFPSINTVVLLGRGETFMMRDIFPILDLGSRKGIHFTIITNGIMLTAEVTRKVPDTGKIIVSIDHPDAAEYKKIRRGGDLNTIVSNLKALKKIKPRQWLCIQGLIINNNIDYAEGFIRLAKEVSADAVKFIYPVIFTRAMSNIYIEPSEDIIAKVKKAGAYARKMGIRFIAVPGINRPRVCVEPWFELRISLNGDIYPCCYINNSNDSSWREWYKEVSLRIPQSNYVMGNIYDKSVGTVWNGDKFRLLRKEVRNTRQNALMSANRLNELRSKIDTSRRFSYCSVCLYRQNKAC